MLKIQVLTTKDRYQNLFSLFVGIALLSFGQVLLSYESYILNMFGYLLTGFVYFIVPHIVFSKRAVINKKHRYYNADLTDITEKLPNNIIKPITILVLMIIFLSFVYYYALIHQPYHHYFRALLTIIPHSVIHSYFFTKDLPFTMWVIYFIGEEGAYGVLKKALKTLIYKYILSIAKVSKCFMVAFSRWLDSCS